MALAPENHKNFSKIAQTFDSVDVPMASPGDMPDVNFAKDKKPVTSFPTTLVFAPVEDLEVSEAVENDNTLPVSIVQTEPDLEVGEAVDAGKAIEVDESEPELLSLPKFPGAEDQDEIEIDEPEPEIEASDDDNIEVSHDPWNPTHENYLEMFKAIWANIPTWNQHSALEGIPRVINYFERFKKVIRKLLHEDYDGKLDLKQCTHYRKETDSAIKRLKEHLEKLENVEYGTKKKQKAASEDQEGFVKEAGTTTYEIQVPLMISVISRILMTGRMNGKDVEDQFKKLAKKYHLDDREKLQVYQVLIDSGLPLRLDMARIDELWDPQNNPDGEWAENYPA